MDGVSCCFIVMELCFDNYETWLNQRLPKEKPGLTSGNKSGIGKEVGLHLSEVMDILSGLQFIHGMNEIHRDLKPANGISFFIFLS
jgi:serine/threonine protein kinase